MEHDDGVRENIGRVCVVQDSPRITVKVPGGKQLHDSINLLSLTREVETDQERSVWRSTT